MKPLIVALVVGIALFLSGIFLWQDGLNMQKLTEQERDYSKFARGAESRISAGEDKEVIGITLLAAGTITALGSGLVLMRSTGGKKVVKEVVKEEAVTPVCGGCGVELLESDRFCPKCGIEFEEDEEEP